MGFLGGSVDVGKITQTVSGIAEGIKGEVSDFRGVLDLNTHLSPFKFPPQVEQGIQIANQLGIKVPSADELKSLALGEVDKYLGGLLKDVNAGLDTIDGLLGNVTTLAGDAETELQKLTWLL
jgi:hypothetical protein